MRSPVFAVQHQSELDPRRDGLVIPVRRNCPEIYIPNIPGGAVLLSVPTSTNLVNYTGSNLLNGAITIGATTINIDTPASGGLDAPSGEAIIETEWISYTGNSGTQLTGVTRGFNGTDAAAHADNVAITKLLPSTATTIPIDTAGGVGLPPAPGIASASVVFPSGGVSVTEWLHYTGNSGAELTGVTRDLAEVGFAPTPFPNNQSLIGHDAVAASWTELHSAALFGDVPRVLVGLSLSVAVGQTLTSIITTRTSGILSRCFLAIGAAGLEELIASVRMEVGAVGQISTTDAAATVTAVGTAGNLRRVVPRLISPLTRLSAKYSAVGRDKRSAQAWPCYYDFESWQSQKLAIDPAFLWFGGYDQLGAKSSDAMILATSSAPSAVGNFRTVYVDGLERLTADYLILGASLVPIDTDFNASGNDERIEIHVVDQIGNESLQTLQSELRIGRANNLVTSTSGFDFPTPFIAYAGEILRLRYGYSADTTAYRGCRVALSMWRIT